LLAATPERFVNIVNAGRLRIAIGFLFFDIFRRLRPRRGRPKL
jgi:hypothetical protein